MQPDIEHFRGIQLSPEDNARWHHAVEALSRAHIPSDLYNGMNLKGKRGAVIGPWYLPHDVFALQLAHSIGPEGELYSIDPRGDDPEKNECNTMSVGCGNSTVYAKDLELLRGIGFPLASLHWLGPDSSLVHIPEPAQNMDIVADHLTVEFVGLATYKGAAYVKQATAEIINSLRVGGMWVHQAETRDVLPYLLGTQSLPEWMEAHGMRVHTHVYQNDGYRLPIHADVLQTFLHSGLPERIFSSRYSKDIRMSSIDALSIPEQVVEYPAREVFIAQRMW